MGGRIARREGTDQKNGGAKTVGRLRVKGGGRRRNVTVILGPKLTSSLGERQQASLNALQRKSRETWFLPSPETTREKRNRDGGCAEIGKGGKMGSWLMRRVRRGEEWGGGNLEGQGKNPGKNVASVCKKEDEEQGREEKVMPRRRKKDRSRS